MALTDDLSRLMGFNQGPDNNAEVNIRIKPLGSPMSPTLPSETSGGGSAAGGGGGTAIAPSAAQGVQPGVGGSTPSLPQGFGLTGASVVPEQYRRPRTNPTLVTHPLGAQTDDIYESAAAQLAFNTQKQYADLLQQIGFLNEQGQFLPGTLETEAIRRRSELNRERDLALQQVQNNAIRGGTVFSGRRATLTGQAQAPYDAALSELETVLGRELGGRYQSLADLNRVFELQRNMLLAEAAERIAGRFRSPFGGGGGPSGPSGPGDDTTPPPGPTEPTPVLPPIEEWPPSRPEERVWPGWRLS